MANIFIDGGYISRLVEDLGYKTILKDYRKYSNVLQSLINDVSGGSSAAIGRVEVTRKFYYDAIVCLEDDPYTHQEQKTFFDNVQLHMLMTEVKLGDMVERAKIYSNSESNNKGKTFQQKGVDTLIAIDMLVKAYLGHYDVAYLIAGDRDFVNVVKAVKNFTGKIVVGVYEPKSTAKELIKTFDLRRPMSKEELKKIWNLG